MKEVIDAFHDHYYHTTHIEWLGIPVRKCPLDLWIYQEIMFAVKPDVIIECGTYMGGSAYFLSSICDLMNKGKVITIDIQAMEQRPAHPRIIYLLGSSTSEAVYSQVKSMIAAHEVVMVILDSDHSKHHVLHEMNLYGQLVTPGSYMIVEDTNINGHPVLPGWGPGPMEAVAEFVQQRPDFRIDHSREKLILTYNPSGYLQKI